MPMDSVQFRRTVGLFATGVTVVTTRLDGTMHGMTANSFTSISLDPTLVLISVENNKHMHTVLQASGVFAVNVLGADQEALARYFASPGRPRGPMEFEGIEHDEGLTGAPLLAGAIAYVECNVATMIPAGDHTLYLGEVVSISAGRHHKEPLIFFRGKYNALRDGDQSFVP